MPSEGFVWQTFPIFDVLLGQDSVATLFIIRVLGKLVFCYLLLLRPLNSTELSPCIMR